ncbi:MAG: hypothetical protein SV765_16680 [Pseudomonadota bacterium]|nr:hypothetical protein [Pseudomonadales bacterium]MDY6921836.1 hypothetical protein [Pseudomonadota bacterium]
MIFRYSLLYFALVFLAGFLLGTLRVLLLAPAVGEHSAELMEMPVMVLVCFLAARFVIKKGRVRIAAKQALLIGVLALVYLLVVELSLVLWLRGISIADYLGSKKSMAGMAYLVSLLLYTLLPYAVIRSKTGG